MNAQIHYRFRGKKPTRADVERAREVFRQTGKSPNGVQIRIVCFGGSPRKWREVWGVGCPGIVDRYHVPGVTLCDYDVPTCPSLERVFMLSQVFGVGVKWAEYTKTRRGWHLSVCWKRKWDNWQTVAIQAMLGSDWKREALGFARLLWGGSRPSRHWNLLFSEKLERGENDLQKLSVRNGPEAQKVPRVRNRKP